jgi:hypothetical protein
MSDVPPIDGLNPTSSSSLSSDRAIDPEKFKKIMKVENSEESAKKQKRHQTKKQEGDDELDKEDLTIATPKAGKFESLMEGTDREVKFASRRKNKVSVNSETGIDLSNYNPIKLTKTTKASEDSFLHLEEILPNAKAIAPKKKVLTKPHLDHATIEALQKKDSGEILAQDALYKIKKADEEQEEQIDVAKDEEPATLLNLQANQLFREEEKSAEETEEIHKTKQRESSKEEKSFKKQSAKTEADQITLQVQPQEGLKEAGILSAPTPAYATLPSELYELFEKMVGLLMIEESKGISITTIKLNMPASIFNGCEIRLEHYDIAPNSFNIQLIGNPSAINLFNQHFSKISSSLKTGGYKFEANLKRPILSDTYQSFSKGKPLQNKIDEEETAI